MKTWLQQRIQSIGIILLLAVASAVVVHFYFADHDYILGTDPAVAMNNARAIVDQRSLNPERVRDPDGDLPIYTSIVSQEIPLQFTLAATYHVFTLVDHEIEMLLVMRYFMVVVIVTSVLAWFQLARGVGMSVGASVGTAITVMTTEWAVIAYINGHVAQLFTMPFLAWYLLSLYQLYKTERSTWLYFALGLLVFIFFSHILTFVLAWLIGTIYLFYMYFTEQSSFKHIFLLKWWPQVIGGLTLILLTVLLIAGGDAAWLPQFDEITSRAQDVPGIFTDFQIRNLTLFGLLVAAGWWIWRDSSQRAHYTLPLVWFLVALTLSANQYIFGGEGFVPYRFSEFLLFPAWFIVWQVGDKVFKPMKKPIVPMAVGGVFLLVLMMAHVDANDARKRCYLNYCPGLHPATLEDNNYEAFLWMEQEIPAGSVVAAYRAQGVFIPGLTGSKVLQIKGTNQVVLISPDPNVRYQKLLELGADYVYWDAVMTDFGNTYEQVKEFTEGPFQSDHFSLIYDNGSARLYEIVK